MGKKNIFIGLSTLLLVLLLGLSTRTYADTYRTWEADDVRNVIYNFYVGRASKTDAETTAFISNNSLLIQEITLKLNSTDNIIVTEVYSGPNSGYGLVFVCSAHANPQFYQSTSNNKNILHVNNRNGNDIFYYFTYLFQTGSRTNLADISSQAYKNDFLYTSTPIRKANPTTGQILFDVGYTAPSNLLDGPYTQVDDGIRFVPYPDKISDVYIGQNYDLTAYGCSKNNTYKQMRFGYLYQPSNYLIEEIDVTMSYYNRGKNKWIETYLLIETGKDLVPSNYKSSIANFKWEEVDSDYTIKFTALIDNEYVHDDCLYHFSFIGKDNSGTPFYIEQDFYIIGSNTVISDGVLDISFLQTGDYANDYANDLNDLAKRINDTNDFIDAVEQGNINSWLPGSGDWSSLAGLVGSGDSIINTANLWGFRNYSNVYWDSLYTMLSRTFSTLSQTGDVTLNLSFHGTYYSLSTSQISPPPAIIRNFTGFALTTFCMIALYKYFSKSIEKIKMVDTSNIKQEANNDSDLM